MARDNHGSSVGTYILIALVLGVITYIEFAIVEYPQAWLGSTMTLVVLAALSVLKFILVVMFFMHLKDDDRMYSGFFSSGMVIALATFIAMTALFILPRTMGYSEARARAESLEGHASAHGEAHVPEEVAALIESDGASRPAAERADTPAPVDRSVPIEAPRADDGEPDYEVLGLADEAPAAPAPQAQAAPAAEEEAAPAAGEEVAQAADWDRTLGSQTYSSTCSGCHQANGQGLPGVFPPLAGHAAEVYAAGGRDYLVQVVLFGLMGQIQVQGATYNGAMPGWSSLNDEQVAAVLNHVVAGFGEEPAGFVPYTAADVAGHRGDGLSPDAVRGVRDQLGLN